MFGKAYQIFQRNIHGEKDSRQAKGRDDIMPGKLVYELLKKERNKQKHLVEFTIWQYSPALGIIAQIR